MDRMYPDWYCSLLQHTDEEIEGALTRAVKAHRAEAKQTKTKTEDELWDELKKDETEALNDLLSAVFSAIAEIVDDEKEDLSDFADWMLDQLIDCFDSRVLKVDDGEIDLNTDLFAGVLFGALLIKYLIEGDF